MPGAVDNVFAYLRDQSLAGGATGWELRRRKLDDPPGAPDRTVVVAEDGGLAPEIPAALGIGDSALGDAGVLITVRAEAWESDVSAAKAAEVLTSLHGLRSATVGSTLYLRVRALTPEPVFVGFDDRGRPRHTIAFRLLAPVLAA